MSSKKITSGGTVIGYARVSSTSQDLDLQTEALRQAGCSVIRSEKVSGKSRDGRTELATIMDFLRPGDIVTVTRLDRLGRDLRDVLNIVHELHEKGASLRVLSPDVDTSGPMGKVFLTVFGMVAEMERSFIRERQAAGIEAAKAKGVYTGRKPKLDPAKIASMKSEGKSMAEIAKTFGVTRQGLYKAMGREVRSQ